MADLAAQAACAIRQHQMLQSGDTVIAACSGGADSVALFHFLFSHAAQLGIHVRCAHVEHGMRGAESRADAAFVAGLCKAWGVPLDTCRLSPPPGAGEDWARRRRYAFFDELAARYGAKIATAHTQSDNAETVLLNLARGAGVWGAAGIPPVRGAYVRPLLDCTRQDVLDYLAQHGLPHCEDATNAGDHYARNRMRHTVLPALEAARPGAAKGLARFAGNAREAAAYLDEQAAALLESALRTDACGQQAYAAAALAAAHPAVRKAALRLLLAPFADPTQPRLAAADAAVLRGSGEVQLSAAASLCAAQGLVRIRAAAQTPRPQGAAEKAQFSIDAAAPDGTAEKTQFSGGPAAPDGTVAPRAQAAVPDLLTAPAGLPAPEPVLSEALRAALLAWSAPLSPGETAVPGGGSLVCSVCTYEEFVNFEKDGKILLKNACDYDKITNNLLFRTRRSGDVFAPARTKMPRALKKLFSEAKLGQASREASPLLVRGSEVVWCAPFGFAAGFAPQPGHRVLWLQFAPPHGQGAESAKNSLGRNQNES